MREGFPKEMIMELRCRRNDSEAEVCLLNRVEGIFHAERTGYSRVDHLARRMAPPRNWKKAPEAEVQTREPSRDRPCKNMALKSNRKFFCVVL